MASQGNASPPITRTKDGREWRIGDSDDVAWIAEQTVPHGDLTFAVPPVFQAYCKLELPERREGAQRRHDVALVTVLTRCTPPQPWWLGYLDTGPGTETIFYDVPPVELYSSDWNYVLIEAGPTEALTWRSSEGRWAWKGALPDLMFPRGRSWLLSTLWDERWSSIGGSEALIASIAHDPELGPRTTPVPPA